VGGATVVSRRTLRAGKAVVNVRAIAVGVTWWGHVTLGRSL
jgi:hypothetical protein